MPKLKRKSRLKTRLAICLIVYDNGTDVEAAPEPVCTAVTFAQQIGDCHEFKEWIHEKGRPPLPKRAKTWYEVLNIGLQRRDEPRRRQHVADRFWAKGVDGRRRGKNRRAREKAVSCGSVDARIPGLGL